MVLELFNASFFPCWVVLQDQFKHQLVHSLKLALKVPLCGAPQLAKALHYREVEIKTMEIGDLNKGEDRATVCEALSSINQQLDLPEAAMGMLLVIGKNLSHF